MQAPAREVHARAPGIATQETEEKANTLNTTNPAAGPAINTDADPAVRELVLEFALPLAVLGAGGTVEIANDAFKRMFDVNKRLPDLSCGVPAAGDEKDRYVQLAARDGSRITATAHPFAAGRGALLLADASPGAVARAQIEQLQQRVAELEKLSSTDALTGAWNRAHFDRVIGSELARSLRLKQPLAMLMLDIDHFKRVNDRFGHQAGDSVLRELVGLVGASVRASDMLFRWGGEEFVVLVPATGYRNAAVVAESLRSRVEAHSFATVGRVTVSVGVAEHSINESAQEWFARVDAALYAAKEGGRNRAIVERKGSSDIWAKASGASALHLAWSEAYECGEPTIDCEHRELFTLANNLIDASFDKEGAPGAYFAALDRLLAHVVHHFADEEALLGQRHYVHLAAHKRAHAGLLARATKLRADAVAGTTTTGDLVEFLANDIVARHLFTADREFFPLFSERV